MATDEHALREARDAIIKDRIDHERASGKTPDIRRAEKWAQEVARRFDREQRDRKPIRRGR